jgi:hypothetical protein
VDAMTRKSLLLVACHPEPAADFRQASSETGHRLWPVS